MDDLISRQAVLDALRARFGVDFDYGKWWNSTHVLAALESVPPVTTQEPCEDAISRRTVQDYIAKYLSQYLYNDVREAVEVIEEYIGELPSVKPQYTDAEIQKMQELEQAEIEKAYEIGKDEGGDVLDKIRAEIMSKDGLEEALEIIDKYRAESEE